MRNKLINDLNEKYPDYPVLLQGSLSPAQEYPEAFFTFWNYDTEPQFYDDDAKREACHFWLYFYSSDPDLVDSVMKNTQKYLRTLGYFVGGATDAQSDEKTHTGKMCSISYITKEE